MTEKQNAAPDRIPWRLPRLGCFLTFLIVFSGTGLLSTVLVRTLLYTPPAWEKPEGAAFLGDPEGILLESDKAELQKLAEEIAALGQCQAAVMFVDEKTAPFADILRAVASEWAPAKGVLLLAGTRNRTLRLQLLGEGWRLAGWSQADAARLFHLYPSYQRGALAVELLKRLKTALEKAAAIPGEAARIDTPVLLSAGEGAKDEAQPHPATFALFSAGLALVLGALFLRNGRKTLQHLRQTNPETEADYRQRVGEKPRLRLVDMNQPKSGWMHAKGARIAAIVLALFFGISPLSTEKEPVSPDHPVAVSSAIPETPEGRVVDCAGVFSPEGKQMLAAAIDHAERATGGEIMVLTVDTVGDDQSIEEFSLETASAWQIGKKGKDNGALLVLAIKDRKNRLEIGYGWEGPINDAKAGDMLRAIVPELRAEKYAEASAKVVAAIEQAVTGVAAGGPSAAKPPVLVSYPAKPLQPPAHDPRQPDPAASGWALFGILGTLIGLAMMYRGRVIATAAPHWVVFDPDEVRHYSSSGSYDYDSDSDSSSSSGSDSDSGGGGSFGGGGASGSW